MRSLLSAISVDTTPLRSSRDFRFIFMSGLITYLGSMITYVALPFQVAQLTDSYLAVGAIGLVELVPLIVFGLYGGALADFVDRRILVLATEFAMLLLVIALVVNALAPTPQLWLLYVIAGLLTAADGLQRPSLDAIIPRIVPHDQLAAAGALTSMRWNFGQIVGPAIGGLLLAAGGTAFAYGVDAITFAVSLVLLWRITSVRAIRDGDDASRPSFAHILEGFKYAVSRRDLLGTYVVDLIAMIFAFPYALFPFLATELNAEWALGLLYSAGAIGGLTVTLTSGWVSRVHRHGRMIVIAAAIWGLGIALVGIAPGIWWALAFLVLAGAADMTSGIFRGLMWNQTIPDELRGRMASIEMLSYSIGPLLGQLRSSTAASWSSLRMSFFSGGVLCVIGVGIAPFVLPALWSYNALTDPHARAVREQHRPNG